MNTNQGHQAQVDAQRILILFSHAPYSLVGVILAAVTVGYVSYDALPFSIWLGWILGILASIPMRILIILRLARERRRGTYTARVALRLENLWLIVSSLTALTLAVSAFLPYKANELTIMLFIGLVICALIGGSATASVTSIRAVMVFLHLAIIPFIAACFMYAEPYFVALGCFFIAFYFASFSLCLRMYHTMVDAIAQQIERQDMSLKDSLTGLWNRRKLFDVIDHLGNRSYSVLLIDVDHFKQLNDEKGHQAGDEMLTQISLCIVRCCDSQDLVVRYGGEEFLILLTGKDLDTATEQAGQIKHEVAQEGLNTVSIGVANSDLHRDFDAVVEAADKAMYRAKKEGRNRVRVDNPQLERYTG